MYIFFLDIQNDESDQSSSVIEAENVDTDSVSRPRTPVVPRPDTPSLPRQESSMGKCRKR